MRARLEGPTRWVRESGLFFVACGGLGLWVVLFCFIIFFFTEVTGWSHVGLGFFYGAAEAVGFYFIVFFICNFAFNFYSNKFNLATFAICMVKKKIKDIKNLFNKRY